MKATTSNDVESVYDEDPTSLEYFEIAENYNLNLLKEREIFLSERQNSERLSHGIESYVIEDAKV